MGWCSGTEIFDNVVGNLLDEKVSKEKIIEDLIDVLTDHDWDCESDSEYFTHELVSKIFRKKYPHWYEE